MKKKPHKPSPIDALEAAAEREMDARKCRVPELITAADLSFKCELCGHTKPSERRREPDSEICIDCVIEAGFYDY